jgi:hypothetical protein
MSDKDIFEITHRINEDGMTVAQLCQRIGELEAGLKDVMQYADHGEGCPKESGWKDLECTCEWDKVNARAKELLKEKSE